MSIDGHTLDLTETYLHLADGADVTDFAGGDAFWQTMEAPVDLDQGRLVCVCPQRADWLVWERHPAGEEVVMLLSGKVDMILDLPEGEKLVSLRPQQTVVIPRNIWHRALVHEPGDALFITRGAGTEHRPFEAEMEA